MTEDYIKKSKIKDWKLVILFILAWLIGVMILLTLLPFASHYVNWITDVAKL